jgi:hypothetical protein
MRKQKPFVSHGGVTIYETDLARRRPAAKI